MDAESGGRLVIPKPPRGNLVIIKYMGGRLVISKDIEGRYLDGGDGTCSRAETVHIGSSSNSSIGPTTTLEGLSTS
jgi:hypothetical protein